MEVSVYPNHFPKVFNSFSMLVDKDTKSNFDAMTQVKNLGCIIDDALSLEAQIKQVVKTYYYRLNNLYRICNMLSKDKKLQFVVLYVFSCLD